MDRVNTDQLLERTFRARRVVLRAGGVFVGLLFALFLSRFFLECRTLRQYWSEGAASKVSDILTEYGDPLVAAALLVVTLVVLIGLLVTCYYVFRVGLREAGLAYAVGHVLLLVGLAFIFLTGIIVVPLLIRCDIERWRRCDDVVS